MTVFYQFSQKVQAKLSKDLKIPCPPTNEDKNGSMGRTGKLKEFKLGIYSHAQDDIIFSFLNILGKKEFPFCLSIPLFPQNDQSTEDLHILGAEDLSFLAGKVIFFLSAPLKTA